MAILKLLHIKERVTGNKSQGLKNVLKYIFNPEKTDNLTYIGGNHCPFFSAEIAYQKMLQTKRVFNKLSGRQGYHYVLSFKPEEAVTPQLCKKITEEFIKSTLDDYEAVYAVHTDRDHMHAHIVFNSVSCSTGLKYHYSKGQWRKDMMPAVNALCRKYGLSEIELVDTENRGKENLRHDEWEARKKGKYTVLSHIQHDIDELVTIAESYEDFIQLLKEKGYGLRENAVNHKTLSLIPPGYSKAIRPSTSLGADYTPEGIRKRLTRHQNQEIYTGETTAGDMPENKAADYVMHGHKRSRKRLHVVVIHKGRFSKKNVRPYKLTYFQIRYLKYCRFFGGLVASGHAYDSWRYSKDLIYAQKLLNCIGLLVRSNIDSKDKLEKLKQVSAKDRNKIRTIEEVGDRVAAFSKSKKETISGRNI